MHTHTHLRARLFQLLHNCPRCLKKQIGNSLPRFRRGTGRRSLRRGLRLRQRNWERVIRLRSNGAELAEWNYNDSQRGWLIAVDDTLIGTADNREGTGVLIYWGCPGQVLLVASTSPPSSLRWEIYYRAFNICRHSLLLHAGNLAWKWTFIHFLDARHDWLRAAPLSSSRFHARPRSFFSINLLGA